MMENSYVGQVLKICGQAGTIHIIFIVKYGKMKGCYKWPVVELN